MDKLLVANESDLRTIISEEINRALGLSAGETKKTDEAFLCANEVRQIFNISKLTLHNWKKSGKVPFYQTGRKLFYKKSEIEAALKNKGRKS